MYDLITERFLRTADLGSKNLRLFFCCLINNYDKVLIKKSKFLSTKELCRMQLKETLLIIKFITNFIKKRINKFMQTQKQFYNNEQ